MGRTEVSATRRELKESGVMVPIVTPFKSPSGTCRKTILILYRFNQVVTSLAAALPNEVSLAEKVNMASGTWSVAIDWANVWFSIPVGKENQKQSVFLWTGQ